MCNRILEFSDRLRQSIAKDILLKLQQGTNPALLGILQPCSVLSTIGLIVIQATCIAKKPQK